jgi:transcriptional regulator with XRE-family HTH domain
MKKSPHPTDVHVGSRVRMRRMIVRKSQTNLGDALDLTFQQIQKYEKGTNRISSSRLQQIADALEVPVTFFFEGLQSASGGPSNSFIMEYLSSPDGLRLAKAFCSLKSGSLRRSIVMLVDQIASHFPEG